MPTFTLSPGNTLAYEHVAPSDTGKTFVCFNALSGDMSMWTASISEALKARGHGWLIYNLFGQCMLVCRSVVPLVSKHIWPAARARPMVWY